MGVLELIGGHMDVKGDWVKGRGKETEISTKVLKQQSTRNQKVKINK